MSSSRACNFLSGIYVGLATGMLVSTVSKLLPRVGLIDIAGSVFLSKTSDTESFARQVSFAMPPTPTPTRPRPTPILYLLPHITELDWRTNTFKNRVKWDKKGSLICTSGDRAVPTSCYYSISSVGATLSTLALTHDGNACLWTASETALEGVG